MLLFFFNPSNFKCSLFKTNLYANLKSSKSASFLVIKGYWSKCLIIFSRSLKRTRYLIIFWVGCIKISPALRPRTRSSGLGREAEKYFWISSKRALSFSCNDIPNSNFTCQPTLFLFLEIPIEKYPAAPPSINPQPPNALKRHSL